MTELAGVPASDPVMEGIGRFVAGVVDGSTNGHDAEPHLLALDRRYPDREVTIVRLQAGAQHEDRNREAILEALSSDPDAPPVLISVGGDGAVHFTGRLLTHPDTVAAGKADTPWTPWKSGNACDEFYALHVPSLEAEPEAMFDHPNLNEIELQPWEWEIIGPDGTVSKDLMMLYGTIGATAKIANRLDALKHRAYRERVMARMAKLGTWAARASGLVVDAAAGIAPVTLPPRFPISRPETSELPALNGRVADAQFIINPIMGRHGRYPVPAGGQQMHVGEVRHGHPFAVMAAAIRMARGTSPGHRVSEAITFEVTSDGLLILQIDGEDRPLGTAGTYTITVRPSKHRLRTLATKPV